jgi:hypothetical protein
MIIARDSRFAAVVIHSKIRVEVKHKAQGKTQNGIVSMLLLRDGGIDDEGVITNPDCRRRSSRRRQLSGDRRQRHRRRKNSRGLPSAKESNSIVTKSSLAEGRVRPILFDLVFDLESEDL